MFIYSTAKVKLDVSSEIIQTFKVYQKALQFCINQAWHKKIKNNIKLHPFVYPSLRKRGLQAQLCIACIKQACGMVKKAKTKPIIKNCSIRYNFYRSASIVKGLLSLATIKGRQKFAFNIPKPFKKYFKWDMKEGLLRFDKKGRLFFLFCFAKEIILKTGRKVLGIDLGIKNLAVCSDGRFFKPKMVKSIKRKYKYLRGRLQAKGTRSAKRLLRKISGKEKRFMAWVNHNVSKQIVSTIKSGKIVMENLKGIRKQRKGKLFNWWISNWSFYQLQSFIEYKANMKGIAIEKVNPFMTSQICHRCGKVGSRLSGCFSCSHCGLSSFNSDLNAGRNLAHPMLGERQAAITQPNSSCDDTEGQLTTEVEHRAKYPLLQ